MLMKVLSANAATSTSAEKISGQTNKQTNLSHLTISRLMSDNVNKIRDLIKYILINFPNQLAWFSMSR